MRYGRYGILWFKAGRVGKMSWMNWPHGWGRWFRFGMRGLGTGSASELKKSFHDRNTDGRGLCDQDESLNRALGGARSRRERGRCGGGDRERNPETIPKAVLQSERHTSRKFRHRIYATILLVQTKRNM